MITDGKKVLVTGGTGSFGNSFVRRVLEGCPKKVVVFSRDELKQYEMRMRFGDDKRLQFFIGDVRDRDRLYRAFDGIDLVVHAAALKQIPSCEYNPFEAIATNIIGGKNVIDAAIDRRVSRVVALSTDKACSPINLYGATKLCSDKLMVAGNSYSGSKETRFSVVRYGNVAGSRGSVIPLFKKMVAENKGVIPITDERMTRFWITLPQGVEMVLRAFSMMKGGEIFVPKLPSCKIIDLAEAIAPGYRRIIVGIRPGEKLHETMIGEDDSKSILEFEDHYVISPVFHPWCEKVIGGRPVAERFCYSSDNNDRWLSVEELKRMI